MPVEGDEPGHLLGTAGFRQGDLDAVVHAQGPAPVADEDAGGDAAPQVARSVEQGQELADLRVCTLADHEGQADETVVVHAVDHRAVV